MRDKNYNIDVNMLRDSLSIIMTTGAMKGTDESDGQTAKFVL
jgi:hypothetical protein